MDKNKLDIFIPAFGKKLDVFIEPLTRSIKMIYPEIEPKFLGKNVPLPEKDNQIIKDAMATIPFLGKHPGSLQTVCRRAAFNLSTAEWILFMDTDMLLIKPIDKFLMEGIDYIYTWRKAKQPVNCGLVLCRNTQPVEDFFKVWEKQTLLDGKEGKNTQHSFLHLLEGEDLKAEFVRYGIKFKGINVNILNRSRHFEPINEDCHVLHFKGPIGRVITNRGSEVVKKLRQKTTEELANFKKKLDIWKSFADPEIAKNIQIPK